MFSGTLIATVGVLNLVCAHPKVIIARYTIKQDAACSRSGVELYPNARGICVCVSLGFLCFVFFSSPQLFLDVGGFFMCEVFCHCGGVGFFFYPPR